MIFHIITLFPESFESYINSSILARAIKEKKIKVKFYNPRDFIKIPKSQKDKEKPYIRVDDKPYGGGPGMVMLANPILKILNKISNLPSRQAGSKSRKIKIIHLSPGGEKFTNVYAEKTAKKYDETIIVCGRYEGIDARVKKIFKGDELSVGNYTLTGGELPAMIIMDSVARQINGVLGNFDSVEEKRFASSDVYTRPEVLEFKGKKYRVPKILVTGHHKKIEEWRKGKK